MKRLKQLAGVLLSLAMLLTLALPAYAVDGPFTITITGDPGHTYEAYQIFKGDLHETTTGDESDVETVKILSNIQWGSGISEDGRTALEAEEGKDTAAKWAESLENEAAARAFAQKAGQYLETAAATSTPGADGDPYTITVTEPGYYLIKDKNNPNGEGQVHTEYILQVVSDVEVTPKGEAPTVEKEVQEVNDSTADEPTWGDTADHDIGDEVSFRLTGTLPSNYDTYTSYKYIFHDTLSSGLTFDPDSVTVTAGETPLKSTDYTLVYAADGEGTAPEDGCTFHLEIANLKLIDGLTKESTIVVTYAATLNEGATIGGEGNPNTVHLEYSNNPNQGGEGDTGKTPENKVTVFTFQLDIDKVDEDEQPLKGAGFTLYKYDADAKGEEEIDKWIPVGTEIKGEDLTSFTWEGLDAGRYKLVESTTPSGYNTMEDIEFTITATFSDEDPVSVDALNVAVTENPNLAEQPEMNGEPTTGTISSTVVNESGAQLPSTGGIGTTIFYVVGGVLVVRAVVLLIAKRRVARR